MVAANLAAPANAAGRRDQVGIVLKVRQTTQATIASGFVGLAFEADVLGQPVLDPTQSNLPSFLAELGDGNIRFGGQSSDQSTAWESAPSNPIPSWASSAITPGDLTTVADLAQETGWSVDLGVNLFHYNPSTAASEVKTAQSILGSSLHAVEIGNEPDLYGFTYGASFTVNQYISELGAYQTAIRASDPGVSLAGPDLYSTNWLQSLTRSKSTVLAIQSEVTQHFYPTFDCGTYIVSPAVLLSPESILTEDSVIGAAKVPADKAHLPLVLDEFNSVSCGGSSPVVHEFASALWAVDALLQAASKGVASVNVEMGTGNCLSYTPLCAPDPSAPGTLEAEPIFYGMRLVSSLEGGTLLKIANPSTKKLPSRVSDYAVRLRDGNVAVVVDNATSSNVSGLSLNLNSTTRVVSTLSLQGPSLDASDGVTLTSAPDARAATGLTVPAQSAVVFTLSP
jgi:hypothetical protein